MNTLFSSITASSSTMVTYLVSLVVALLCGVITALAASFRNRITRSMAASLVLLPGIVATVILMVNGSVGTGIAVAGAFSLIRFRSFPGKAKDIVLVFLAMTAGLTCAGGYIFVALIMTVLICLAMIVLTLIPMKCDRVLELRVTVPETLDYVGAFQDIFAKYLSSCRLVSVKTTNMGSLYKLIYRVEMKDIAKGKEFLDEVRTRNGNLEISLGNASEGSEDL